jgi:adenosylcobinamide-GDP ribazoletransferase
MVRSEWRQLAASLQFLTRLPIPKSLNPTTFEFAQAIKYFPLVGLILGGILAGLAYLLSLLQVSLAQSAIILVAMGVGLTGAFHEDGLADACDGLGGAFERSKKLEIMKDSRIGTYGATALVLLLLFRVELWTQPFSQLMILIPISWMWARYSTIPMVMTTIYVSSGTVNKPLLSQVTMANLIVSSAIVLLGTFFLTDIKTFLILCAANGTIVFGLRKYFVRQVGGYTGDLLGAANLLVELATAWIIIRFHAGH